MAASSLAVLLLTTLLLLAAVAAVRRGACYAHNPLGRNEPKGAPAGSSSCPPPSEASRGSSSWLTVDPSKVLSTLVERGGLVLPASIGGDLRVLRETCSAEESMLDLWRRELLVKNFTVSLPLLGTNMRSNIGGVGGKQDPSRLSALRVGRVKVAWDSYLQPCVDVELSDGVDIVVEFTNLMLTRTNWHELRDFGFPPPLLVGEDVDESALATDFAPETVAVDEEKNKGPTTSTTANTSSSSSFIRIGSMNFTGNVTLRIVSRPLEGEDIVPPFALSLEALSELSKRIREEASANATTTSSEEASSGRPGCTTDAAYDIVQAYFVHKLKLLLASTAFDVAAMREDAAAVRGARRAVTSAKEVAKRYASSVKGLAEKKAVNKLGGIWQRNVLDRLQRRMGVNDDQIDAVRSASSSAAEGAAALLKAALQKRLNSLSSDGDDEEGRCRSDNDERKQSPRKEGEETKPES